jgi:hypothetical protein
MPQPSGSKRRNSAIAAMREDATEKLADSIVWLFFIVEKAVDVYGMFQADTIERKGNIAKSHQPANDAGE